ncbi:ATP-binding cassette domain-containing protein [Microbacterium sp.]|uniref:ABC transporter ATP-binding protein n=1 Tax=Microbacterium sp. TaxID=51671 RepID=UPI003A92AFF1
MPEGQVLEFAGLSKQFGSVLAVKDFTARVAPGAVTGFLGPNGAGKTTTLRMLLGLVRPSAGTATIGGVPYAQLDRPLQTVGAVLEASSFHPGRTAAAHLKVYARAAGLPASRVDEALGLVGLADVGGRKVGGFSLGMRQRLGLAAALLGDPGVLVLDEPVNGLDPEGITWMRGLLRELARQGRTILMSSHLLAEVQQTVDKLLIIAHGRIVYDGPLEGLADASEYATVVDSPDRPSLEAALKQGDISYEVLRSGLTVRGADPTTIGRTAADAGVALSMLQRRGPALEEVFFELVNGIRVHPSAQGAAAGAGAVAAAQAAGPVDAAAATGADAAAVVGAGAADASPDTAVVGADTVDASADAGADAADAAAVADEAPQAPPALIASAATGVVAVAEHEQVDEESADAAPPTGPADTKPSTGGFAVASTGVIDILPPEDEAGDGHADTQVEDPETADVPSTTRPAGGSFAVASTGAIEVIPAAEPETPAAEGDADTVAEDAPTADETEPDEPAEDPAATETAEPAEAPESTSATDATDAADAPSRPSAPGEWKPPTDWWAPSTPAIKPEMFSSADGDENAGESAAAATIGDDDIDEIAGEPDHLDDDESPDDKTESDKAADAFFHSFDRPTDSDDTAPADDAEPADEASTDEASTDEESGHDGGESR